MVKQNKHFIAHLVRRQYSGIWGVSKGDDKGNRRRKRSMVTQRSIDWHAEPFKTGFLLLFVCLAPWTIHDLYCFRLWILPEIPRFYKFLIDVVPKTDQQWTKNLIDFFLLHLCEIFTPSSNSVAVVVLKPSVLMAGMIGCCSVVR